MKNTMINYSKNENIGITKCSELIPLSRIRDNGVINNVVNVIDDNANGIPEEDEKLYERQTATEKVVTPKASVHEKEEKTSLLKMLHDCKPEVDDKPCRQMAPELVL